MSLPKGRSNNLAGKPKGAKNKVGTPLKQRLADWLDDNFDDINEVYNRLDDKDKAKFYTDIIPFAVAKMSSTAITLETEQIKLTVNDLFPDTLKDGQPEPTTPE